MKRSLALAVTLFCWLIQIFDVRAEDTPTITRPVTDLVGVLSQAQVDAIAARLTRHRDATGTQLAALVVPSTGGEPIERYARRVATAWGGDEQGANKGALLVLALDDRKSRLEVGSGLAAALPDASAKELLDAARPLLRDKAYGAAIWAITDSVIVATGGASEPAPEEMASRSAEPGDRPTVEPVPARTKVIVYLATIYLGTLAVRCWPLSKPDPARPDRRRSPTLDAVRALVGVFSTLGLLGVLFAAGFAIPLDLLAVGFSGVAGLATGGVWESVGARPSFQGAPVNLIGSVFLGVVSTIGFALCSSPEPAVQPGLAVLASALVLPAGMLFALSLGESSSTRSPRNVPPAPTPRTPTPTAPAPWPAIRYAPLVVPSKPSPRTPERALPIPNDAGGSSGGTWSPGDNSDSSYGASDSSWSSSSDSSSSSSSNDSSWSSSSDSSSSSSDSSSSDYSSGGGGGSSDW